MFHRFGNMGSGMFFAWLIPIILIIVIISMAVYIIVNNKKENNNTRSNSALKILNERYAKGEIDEEEYKKIKENLSNLK